MALPRQDPDFGLLHNLWCGCLFIGIGHELALGLRFFGVRE
jgi:hypothetical protein